MYVPLGEIDSFGPPVRIILLIYNTRRCNYIVVEFHRGWVVLYCCMYVDTAAHFTVRCCRMFS